MEHALDRVLNTNCGHKLTIMDQERLRALGRFLRAELSAETVSPDFTFAGFGGQTNVEPSYSLDIGLQQLLKNLSAFTQWRPKMGFDKKWQRLVEAVESFAGNPGELLLANKPPVEEFQLLQMIVAELLLHAESTLQI